MKEITRENFNNFIAEGVVVLDFYATWCAPCKALENSLKEFETTHHVPVGKINVDTQRGIANAFGVLATPTVIVMKDGKQVHSMAGAQPLSELEKQILPHMV